MGSLALITLMILLAATAKAEPEWMDRLKKLCVGAENLYYVDDKMERCCPCSPCHIPLFSEYQSMCYGNGEKECSSPYYDCVFEEDFEKVFGPKLTTSSPQTTNATSFVTNEPTPGGQSSTITLPPTTNTTVIIAVLVAFAAMLLFMLVFCKTKKTRSLRKCISDKLAKVVGLGHKANHTIQDPARNEVPENEETGYRPLVRGQNSVESDNSDKVEEEEVFSEQPLLDDCHKPKESNKSSDEFKSSEDNLDSNKMLPSDSRFSGYPEFVDHNSVRPVPGSEFSSYGSSHQTHEITSTQGNPLSTQLPLIAHNGTGNVHVSNIVVNNYPPAMRPDHRGGRADLSIGPSSFEPTVLNAHVRRPETTPQRPCVPDRGRASETQTVTNITEMGPSRRRRLRDEHFPRQHGEYPMGRSERAHLVRQPSNMSSTSTVGAVENDISDCYPHSGQPRRVIPGASLAPSQDTPRYPYSRFADSMYQKEVMATQESTRHAVRPGIRSTIREESFPSQPVNDTTDLESTETLDIYSTSASAENGSSQSFSLKRPPM